MAGNKSRQMNLPLLLPLAGLIVELIVFVILRSYNVTISPSMLFFFALIGLLLAYQIVLQIIQLVKVNMAVNKSQDVKAMVEAGNGLEAIKIWKKTKISCYCAHSKSKTFDTCPGF